MKPLLWLQIILLLFALPATVQAELSLEGVPQQGGLLRGRVDDPQTRVYYGERRLKVDPEGRFIIGFGRDAAQDQSLTLVSPRGEVSTEKLRIAARDYAVQRINGISKRMMEPDAEALRRIRREARQARQAREIDSDLIFFSEDFIWPVTGRISGVYGSQRILNGEPRRPHYGVDIAVPAGTPVHAPAGGRVSLAHPGMFFSGKTLILDHGHGLSSSFLHLQEILVQPGQRVEQGQPIATVGASGRVTGPHLDWRINWFDERLDPALLVPSMPDS